MGLMDRMLIKTLEKQQEKQAESLPEMSPLGKRLMSELYEMVDGMDGAGIAPYIGLLSGILAGLTDDDIQSGIHAIIVRLDHIIRPEPIRTFADPINNSARSISIPNAITE